MKFFTRQMMLCFIFIFMATRASEDSNDVLDDVENLDETARLTPRIQKDERLMKFDEFKNMHGIDAISDGSIGHSESFQSEAISCDEDEVERRRNNAIVTNLGGEVGKVYYNDVGIRIVIEQILELNDESQTALLHFTVEMAYFNDELIKKTKKLVTANEQDFPKTYDANFEPTHEAVPKLTFWNIRNAVGNIDGVITDVQMTMLEKEGESAVQGFFTAKRQFLVEIQDSIQSRRIPFDFQDWNIKLEIDKELYRYDRRCLQFFKFEDKQVEFFPSTFHHELLKRKTPFHKKIIKQLKEMFCIFNCKKPKRPSGLFMENELNYKQKSRFCPENDYQCGKNVTESGLYKKAFQSKLLKIRSESSKDEWYVYGYVQNKRQGVIKQGVERGQVKFRFWTERKLARAVLDIFMIFGVAFISSIGFLFELFPASNAAVACTVVFPTFVAILLMTVYKDHFPNSKMQWLRLKVIFADIFDVIALAVSRSPIFGCIDVETENDFFPYNGSSKLEQLGFCSGEGNLTPPGCYLCLNRDRQPLVFYLSLAIKLLIGFSFFMELLNKDKTYVDSDVYLQEDESKFKVEKKNN